MLSLILALPVGGCLLLICCYVHTVFLENTSYRTLSVIRYLYLSKIIQIDSTPKTSPACLRNRGSSQQNVTKNLHELVNLRVELDYSRKQNQEDTQLPRQAENNLAVEFSLKKKHYRTFTPTRLPSCLP